MIDLDQIRAGVDIVSVIGQYVQLKKRGHQYEGLCPFHTEKTPSFKVHPGKQAYMCWGKCGGGDVFRFIEKIEGVSFREAVRIVAERAGIPIDDTEPTPEERRKYARDRRTAQDLAAECERLTRLMRWRLMREIAASRRMDRDFCRDADPDSPITWMLLAHVIQPALDRAAELEQLLAAIDGATPATLIGAYVKFRRAFPVSQAERAEQLERERFEKTMLRLAEAYWEKQTA